MKRQNGSIKMVVLTAILVVALVAIVGVMQVSKSARGNLQNTMQTATIFPSSRALPEFDLTYQASFTNRDLLGKWTILFFGFTNCPGPCPATLSTMRQVFEVLEADDSLPPIQMVKVTVDPERDDEKTLHDYLSSFDQGLRTQFIGVTGDPQHLADIRNNLGIIAEAIPVESDGHGDHGHAAGHYDIDHSLVILIISPQGELVATSSAPHVIEYLINDITQLTKNWS